jgi:hypothetical protein
LSGGFQAISKNLSADHGHSHSAEHAHPGEVMDESKHIDTVWKGLAALFCIFFFFITERVLTIVTEEKRRKKNMVGF